MFLNESIYMWLYWKINQFLTYLINEKVVEYFWLNYFLDLNCLSSLNLIMVKYSQLDCPLKLKLLDFQVKTAGEYSQFCFLSEIYFF
jgi:hypothetical protein